MSHILSSPDITQKTLGLLWERRRELAPFWAVLFLMYWLSGLARALYPGVYTFDPFDQGWLLIPEAIFLGPVIALMSHCILQDGGKFAWTRESLVVKLMKAGAYYYVLLILFKVGTFVTTAVIPSLLGSVLGPVIGSVFPIVVGVGFVFFMLLYVRLLLVYPVLAGEEREPLIVSMGLTRGKTRQIVSCLLLLGAPVLIPWIAATVYGGNWLDPSQRPGVEFLPIIARSLLLTLGAIVISTGLCVMYEALIAEDGETDQDV